MGQGSARIFNIISLIFLILTILVIIFVIVRMVQPAPAVVVAQAVLPTAAFLPTVTATFTPSPTPEPTETLTPTATETASPIPSGTAPPLPTVTASLTNTPEPSATLTLTPSETPIASATLAPPTATPSLTITPTLPNTATPLPSATPPPTATTGFTPPPTVGDVPSPYPFALRESQPIFNANFANTAGCGWQGIGGQVLGIDGTPLLGVTVHVTGPGVDARVTSGSNTIYGVSGWEVPVGTTLLGNSYRVELLSPGETIISPTVVVTFTLNDCGRNLALVNFQQTRPI